MPSPTRTRRATSPLPARVAGPVIAAVIAVFATPSTAHASGFSCGTRLVTEGMDQYEVRDVCGEPADVQRTTILRRPVVWRHGRPWYVGTEELPVPVETWIYDFGPNRLMRKLRFEDGVLADIETLGHGTHR